MSSDIQNTSRHIEHRYDSNPANEWDRLERHRTEFAVTLRAFDDYMLPPPARVLDCGGGPGRYAIALTRRGYAVTLFDLSAGNLAWATEKATAVGVSLAGYEHGTATDLSRFADETFDVVLLMGPLYHLLDEADRRQALAEAGRVLRPGGQMWVAFITRYAPLRYAAARDVNWVLQDADEAERILCTGVLLPRPDSELGSSFVAYFAHPNEVTPLLQNAGFEVQTVWGVEGLTSLHEEGVNALEGTDWERWLDLNYRVSTDPCLFGGLEHLLVLAVKPRWRAVLRQMVRCLNEDGLTCKVVGGTAIALHGVPLPVRDIDIETDAAGVYRFQALFADRVVQPVMLCNDDLYRSHLGRFDFDGVRVEVMGDLHRREGEAWVPTADLTETWFDLDGVPVRAAWLEEEVLASIRRGRLGRAAQCLPYCDQKRLLALLRGECAVGVL